MLVKKLLLHTAQPGVECEGSHSHLSALLKYDGVVNGVYRVLTPCKGTVRVYQNCRDGVRVEVLEGLYYDKTRVLLILTRNGGYFLLLSKWFLLLYDIIHLSGRKEWVNHF